MRELGADATAEPAGGWEAVADTALLQLEAAALVRDGGRLVGVRPADLPAAGRGVSVRAVSVVPNAERLSTLLQRAERGELPTRIAGELPLTDVAAALRTVARGGVRGRYVLRP